MMTSRFHIGDRVRNRYWADFYEVIRVTDTYFIVSKMSASKFYWVHHNDQDWEIKQMPKEAELVPEPKTEWFVINEYEGYERFETQESAKEYAMDLGQDITGNLLILEVKSVWVLETKLRPE